MKQHFIDRLVAETGIRNLTALMDELQERGLVADEAQTIKDVPDEDALRALVWFQRNK